MNISFHYYAIKTLAYYADIPEKRADEIAFYSQLVDDFNLSWLNPGDGIPLTNCPPDFFLNHKLAVKEQGGWYFYPVTTGISLLQSAYSLLNRRHQYFTIIPFHFIPPAAVSISAKGGDYRCKQADPNGSKLIDITMREFIESGEINDIRLGILLHVYADTYAHQHFSGRWSTENYCTIKTICSVEGNKPISPSSWWRQLPAVGHAELGHVPDLFGADFTADFDYGFDSGNNERIYKRSNMDTFLLCAERIWGMLREYNQQLPLDRAYFQGEIAPKLREAGNACLKVENGIPQPDEWEDASKLKAAWETAFKAEKIKYNYSYSTKWGLKESVSWPFIRYQATDEFFKFNQYAYEHLKKVIGFYREEELYGCL